MSLLKCENVTLGYEGKEILSNISFELNKGDYLCIVGENGSGKSTLMKGILGLIKPYNGKIEIQSGGVGYLPQQTMLQKDFPVSVNEVILSGCLVKHRFNPFYTAGDRKAADEAAKKLEIYDLKKKCYQELSGGQQQRVLLARALCAAGELLILDEPAAGLDPIITNELYDIIDNLNKNDDITVIMVSHDIKAAIKYASHIMHIGVSSCFFGTKEQYLTTESGISFLGGDTNG